MTSIPPPSVESLRAVFGTDDIERRRAVVDVLAQRYTVEHPDAASLLIEALGDDDWRVRRDAMDLGARWAGASTSGRHRAPPDRRGGARRECGGCATPPSRYWSRAAQIREHRSSMRSRLHSMWKGSRAIRRQRRSFSSKRSAPLAIAEPSVRSRPLVRSNDANLAAAAVGALAQIGGEAAEAALLSALDTADPFRQMATLNGLAIAGAQVPFATLRPLIDDSFVRRAAVPLLGRSGDPAAAAPLLDVLRASGSLSTVADVARAMVELAQTVDNSLIVANLGDARGKLRGLLQDGDARSRRAAALLLMIARDEPSLEPLTRFAADEALSPPTLQAIAQWGSDAVLPLVQVSEATVGEQRAIALEMAAALAANEGQAPPHLLHALRKATTSSEPSLRAKALWGLAPFATATDIDALFAHVHSDDDTARAALRGLESLAERRPGILEARLRGLSFEDESARLAPLAAKLLGEEVLDALQSGLSSQSAAHRGACVQAMALVPRPRAAEMVAFALCDEDARVREIAARALGPYAARQARA